MVSELMSIIIENKVQMLQYSEFEGSKEDYGMNQLLDLMMIIEVINLQMVTQQSHKLGRISEDDIKLVNDVI